MVLPPQFGKMVDSDLNPSIALEVNFQPETEQGKF